MNTEKFIDRARQVHGELYGYENVNFRNWKTPILIECSVHGLFEQWPETHLKGAGCKRCKLKQSKEKDRLAAAKSYIQRARKVHGEKYNYTDTEYHASNQKLIIGCYTHGPFELLASAHLAGRGCPKCIKEKRSNALAQSFSKTFIKQAQEVHGRRYDYTDFCYINSTTPVQIRCPIHGIFKQLPLLHQSGAGCKACADKAKGDGRRKKAAAEFVERAVSIHGDKYDYSKVFYVESSKKVEIICLEHGSFFITPNAFFQGSGCKKCGIKSRASKQRTSLEKFVEQARVIHGNKYDYSKAEYLSTHKHIMIICPEHGPFLQAPSGHLAGRGCRLCGAEQCGKGVIKGSLDEFIKKAKEVHGNKYDYSQAIYVNSSTPLIIICPQHGVFLQTPAKHCGGGQNCPACLNRDMDSAKFIARAQVVHGDKYDYSQVFYKTAKGNVSIICKIHGQFEQCAYNHLVGTGCPLCVDTMNSRGVKRIEAWLSASGLDYEREKGFADLRSFKRKRLRFDFFLPHRNILIEFDGQQHFVANEFWGGEKAFTELVANDRRKDLWANEKGYNLIRISFNDEQNIEEILASQIMGNDTAECGNSCFIRDGRD